MLATAGTTALAALASGCRIASRGLSPVQAAMVQCQQVRFARKTFAFRTRYGDEPLYTDNMYNDALEQGQLDDFAFRQFRFNSLWETNSPLQDDVLEKYMRYMQRGGRRNLVYELLHKTFYEIKTIQYRRMKKLEARKRATAEQGTKAEKMNSNAEVELLETNPMQLFHMAIDNCKPYVITCKIKRGGAVYQVPTPIQASISEWMAMRWMNDLVKERPKPRQKHYHEVLAQEIIDAANNRGKVVKRKDDIHKLAQANKAYAHYRWG